MIPTDAELLRRFSRDGAQSAFTELVRRHLDLVYSVALRRLGGDAHRAADVTQSVFIDLARKAERMSSHPVITGWLYTSARHAADQAQRTERRRIAREEAFMRQEPNETAATDDAWRRLRVVLDDAMGDLNEAERTAVLLRFFEDRPFAEIGRLLQLSEEAARKRVTRGLERLEVQLARRGITSTSAALATLITAQSTLAAPSDLALQVTRATASYAGAGMKISRVPLKGIGAIAAALILGVALRWKHSPSPTPAPAPSAPPAKESPPPIPVGAPAPSEKITPPIESLPVPRAPSPPNVPVTPGPPVPPVDPWAQPVSMDFPNEEVGQVLRNLAGLHHLKLELPDPLHTRVSLRLKDMSPSRIFRSLLIPLGYTFTKDGNTIRVLPFPDEASHAQALAELAIENQADATEIAGPSVSSPSAD
ncbi:MAG TPA: sigma-70 family RNA polymerase sigma factor [Bryobacteraceae bacterium]|nr:sigma-70 family RNA polymerase sigma factor [Bryobacteraceae bacterium]